MLNNNYCHIDECNIYNSMSDFCQLFHIFKTSLKMIPNNTDLYFVVSENETVFFSLMGIVIIVISHNVALQ